MKIKFRYTILMIFLIIVFYSCKDDTPDDSGNPSKGEGEIEAKIVLPDGSTVDLSGSLLCSLGATSDLNGNLNGYVPFNDGSVELAYLVDEQDELLLAGFLSDDRNEISVATTVEVLLYFGMGSSLNTLEYKKFFVENIEQEKAYIDLVDEFETAFTLNPKVFSEGGYIEALNNAIIKLAESDTIDVYTKSIDLGSIERSGLSLNEVGKNSFTITNGYPRRTHGFLYFKSYKDISGTETTVNSEISGSDFADQEVEIPFISLADEGDENFQNQVTNFNLCSQGVRYVTKVSDEINIDLPENHTSETYELAVVGPGFGTAKERDFTENEQEVFEQLSIETFVLDYFIPILMDIGGNRDIYSTQVLQKASELTGIVEPILRAHEPSIDAVLENDFETAITEFLPFLYSDIRLSNDLRTIMTGLYGMISDGSSPNTFIQNNELIQEGEARYQKVTSAILRSMKESVGLNCINKRLSSSATLEKWDIKVYEGVVKLKPEKISTVPFGDPKDIFAKVFIELQEGETLEYDWETTSQFGGILNDYNGQDDVSFTTSSDKVAFFSNASSRQLGDGENLETVTVTAYIKKGTSKTEIGSASMTVDVKKKKFLIQPDGVTIKGNDKLKLNLKHSDRTTVIPNAETDYEIVWSTEGKYGLFEGLNNSQTLTNNASITYYADDTEVEKGEETIMVSIYAKSKNSDEPYRLADEAHATIKIENDEKKLIYYAPIGVGKRPPENNGGIYWNYGAWSNWRWNPSEAEADIPDGYEIQKIYMKVMERTPDPIPSCTYESNTWYPGNEEEDLVDGSYELTCSYSGGSALSSESASEGFASTVAAKNSCTGFAQVIVYLKAMEK